jgi:hypothetical protein
LFFTFVTPTRKGGLRESCAWAANKVHIANAAIIIIRFIDVELIVVTGCKDTKKKRNANKNHTES